MVFEGIVSQGLGSVNQGNGSYYNPGKESKLWRKLETDKMIQFEELASKGSERPASMFGPTGNPNERGGTAQGMTSNSIVMSGTPTDVSNYYSKLYNAELMSN